jgi:hypothetical protein
MLRVGASTPMQDVYEIYSELRRNADNCGMAQLSADYKAALQVI